MKLVVPLAPSGTPVLLTVAAKPGDVRRRDGGEVGAVGDLELVDARAGLVGGGVAHGQRRAQRVELCVVGGGRESWRRQGCGRRRSASSVTCRHRRRRRTRRAPRGQLRSGTSRFSRSILQIQLPSEQIQCERELARGTISRRLAGAVRTRRAGLLPLVRGRRRVSSTMMLRCCSVTSLDRRAARRISSIALNVAWSVRDRR